MEAADAGDSDRKKRPASPPPVEKETPEKKGPLKRHRTELDQVEPFAWFLSKPPAVYAGGYILLREWLEGAINRDFDPAKRAFANVEATPLGRDPAEEEEIGRLWRAVENATRTVSISELWRRLSIVDKLLCLEPASHWRRRNVGLRSTLQPRLWWISEARRFFINTDANEDDEDAEPLPAYLRFAFPALILELFYRFVWARLTLETVSAATSAPDSSASVITTASTSPATGDGEASSLKQPEIVDSEDLAYLDLLDDSAAAEMTTASALEEEEEAEEFEAEELPEQAESESDAGDGAEDIEMQESDAPASTDGLADLPGVVSLFFPHAEITAAIDEIEEEFIATQKWCIRPALTACLRLASARLQSHTLADLYRLFTGRYRGPYSRFLSGLGISLTGEEGLEWQWTISTEFVDSVFRANMLHLTESGRVVNHELLQEFLPELALQGDPRAAASLPAICRRLELDPRLSAFCPPAVPQLLGFLTRLTEERDAILRDIRLEQLAPSVGPVSGYQQRLEAQKRQHLQDLEQLIAQLQAQLHDLTAHLDAVPSKRLPLAAGPDGRMPPRRFAAPEPLLDPAQFLRLPAPLVRRILNALLPLPDPVPAPDYGKPARQSAICLLAPCDVSLSAVAYEEFGALPLDAVVSSVLRKAAEEVRNGVLQRIFQDRTVSHVRRWLAQLESAPAATTSLRQSLEELERQLSHVYGLPSHESFLSSGERDEADEVLQKYVLSPVKKTRELLVSRLCRLLHKAFSRAFLPLVPPARLHEALQRAQTYVSRSPLHQLCVVLTSGALWELRFARDEKKAQVWRQLIGMGEAHPHQVRLMVLGALHPLEYSRDVHQYVSWRFESRLRLFCPPPPAPAPAPDQSPPPFIPSSLWEITVLYPDSRVPIAPRHFAAQSLDLFPNSGASSNHPVFFHAVQEIDNRMKKKGIALVGLWYPPSDSQSATIGEAFQKELGGLVHEALNAEAAATEICARLQRAQGPWAPLLAAGAGGMLVISDGPTQVFLLYTPPHASLCRFYGDDANAVDNSRAAKAEAPVEGGVQTWRLKTEEAEESFLNGQIRLRRLRIAFKYAVLGSFSFWNLISKEGSSHLSRLRTRLETRLLDSPDDLVVFSYSQLHPSLLSQVLARDSLQTQNACRLISAMEEWARGMEVREEGIVVCGLLNISLEDPANLAYWKEEASLSPEIAVRLQNSPSIPAHLRNVGSAVPETALSDLASSLTAQLSAV